MTRSDAASGGTDDLAGLICSTVHPNFARVVVGGTCGWCSDAAEVIVREWLPERERAARAEALQGLTDDEADELDRWMSEHMYQHSISNNINGMSCDIGCRTNALRKGVNVLLNNRADELLDDGREGDDR